MSTRPEYTRQEGESIAKHALRILEPIPADKWIVQNFSDDRGARCIIGHHTRLTSGDPSNYDSFNCTDWNETFRKTTRKFLEEVHKVSTDAASVNNYSNINGYTEPEIKDRGMHLLRDMVEHGY